MLQSNRIYLRPLCEDDFEFYKEIYSDSDLMKYVEDIVDENELKKSFETSIRNISKLKSKILIIKATQTDEVIGVTSLYWNQENENDAEIGTIIHKQYQRNNYAEEAMYLLMQNAFKTWKVEDIYGYCNIENTGVSFLTQKMGFRSIKTVYNETRNINEVVWKISKSQLKNRY